MTTSLKNINIGFIGLGKMGAGMCANIQAAGYPLMVFNRTSSKTEPFAANGATVAHSVKAVVAQSDIIFTSVLDDKALLELCEGENGMLAAMKGKIHVGLTTILPDTANRLKTLHEQAGGHYIAAPVVGRPDAAAAGKLITFLAGDAAAMEQALPVIGCYTAKQIPLGDTAAAANGMKICVNYMAMSQLAMLGEIFTYAEKSGLNKDILLAVTKQFFAGNDAMTGYAEKIAARDFDNVGFNLTAGIKDALIFETAFNAYGVEPAAIAAAKARLIAADANGLGDKDWSALTEISRRLAGLVA